MTEEPRTEEQLEDANAEAAEDEEESHRQRLDGAAQGAEAAASPAPERDLAQRLAAAEARAQEHLTDLQRVAADFDNYKKRALREREQLAARAAERLVKLLLPVLDDLERALEAANEHEEAKLEEGVRLVHRALADALAKEGLTEIETDGTFDPHVHEALLAQPGEGVESGAVLQVLQKGYRLGDLVLRPARVIVAE